MAVGWWMWDKRQDDPRSSFREGFWSRMESLRRFVFSHIPSPTSVLSMALGLSCVLKPVHAQYLTRPQIPWRTISTARFDIHFPAEMEQWTRLVAGQMESVADAVHSVVGNSPDSRVTVIVEDPSNVANGFALPF